MSREVRICENCGVKNTIDKLECEACGYDLSFIAPVMVEENNGAKWLFNINAPVGQTATH